MCFDKKKNNRQKGRFCRQRKTSGEPRDGDFIGDLIPGACGGVNCTRNDRA